MAVDPASGDLLVADTGKQLVQRYTSAGAFVSDFDGSGSPDGGFSHLEDVAVVGGGDVFVVDAQGGPARDGSPSRVDRFTAAGVHVSSVRPLQGEGDGFVAVDPHSPHLVVGDARGFSSRLHVIDMATNERVTTIPSAGVALLTGLAFDAGASQRLYVVGDDPFCQGGCGMGGVAFEPNTLPDATVAAATDVTGTSAILHGSVDPNGSPTTARFEVSSDSGGSWSSVGDVDPAPGNGTDPVDVTLTASLSPATTYQVRLVASNPGGGETVSSNVESFTTDAITPPTVTLNPPTDATTDSATISGTVDPQGAQTHYRFETSTDNGASWTQIDPDQDGDEDAGTGNDPLAVTETLDNLEPATTYQIRLIAHNPGGETTADGQSLTTDGQAPTAVTHLIANLRHNSVRLTGFTNPRNQPTTYHFQWGQQPDLTGAQTLPTTADASAGSGGQQVTVAQNLTGLQPNTTYHYRLTTDNPTGPPVQGDTQKFTTRKAPPPMGDGVGAWGDRQIELVSADDTNGNAVGHYGAPQLSPDGNRALYGITAGADESSPTGGMLNHVLANRTPSGWKTEKVMPPRSLFDHHRVDLIAANDDLSRFVVTGAPAFAAAGTGARGRYGLARYLPGSGQLLPGPESTYASGVTTNVYSRDLSRGMAPQPVDAGPVLWTSLTQLYDITGPVREPVGLLPGELEPECGISEYASVAVASQNWVSRDGSFAVFFSRGDDCSGPADLFVRHAGPDGSMVAGHGRTTRISGPVLSGEDDSEGRQEFLQLTDDGRYLFFKTRSRLDVDDVNDGPDVYRHTFGVGNDCVTCAVADSGVETALASPDGSRVYISSPRALAPGAVPVDGTEYYLYVWRSERPDDLDLIARIGGFIAGQDDYNPFVPYNTARLMATGSDDGSTLVFSAGSGEQLDPLTSTTSNRFMQLYRYSDVERSLECLSCPASGATGASSLTQKVSRVSGVDALDRVSPMSDGGFAFETSQQLVAGDINGSQDVYEWRDGRTGLLTPGDRPAPNAKVAAVAPDGGTILFLTFAELVPAAKGRPNQVYAARIGGGFEVSRSVPCAGDGCQGGTGGGSRLGVPGSSSLGGAGDGVVGVRPRLRMVGFGGGGLAALARGRRVVLRVRVNRAGRVSVVGRGRVKGKRMVVLRGSGRARGAGVVRVGLRLSSRAYGVVARSGRLRVRLSVGFSGAESLSRVLVLRRGR